MKSVEQILADIERRLTRTWAATLTAEISVAAQAASAPLAAIHSGLAMAVSAYTGESTAGALFRTVCVGPCGSCERVTTRNGGRP